MKRILVILGILSLGSADARAAQFIVRAGEPNRVVFVSRAPTEKFEGKTNKMEGRLVLDPANMGDSVTVHLEVDMASLDTGIAKRNQHMRENHLETAKYPKAIFEGAAVRGPAGAKMDAGVPVKYDVEGTFTLHGVSRRLRISIEAMFTPKKDGPQIAFQTSFPVALPDYNISRPQFLFMKLGEVQTVRVSGIGTAAP